MMKKILFILSVAALALVSCNKEPGVGNDAGEIVLGLEGDFELNVETRATAINNINGLPNTLYWGATTGSSTETVKYSTTSTTRSYGNIATGKYQTNPATYYNWYVATQTFTMSANPSMSVANNNNDILVGRTANSSSSTPSVELQHIFCRTGSLSLSATNGYSVSSVTWEIQSPSNSATGTAGTYNMKAGTWSNTTRLNNGNWQTITNSSDLYLIPGTYNIRVTYTLSMGSDWTGSSTVSATRSVTLTRGVVNNISGTVTGTGASEITIGVTVEQWGTDTKNVTF